MSGETFSYKFGSKNNWRRWAWNRISERVLVPKRDAVVLYLAGASDLDRPIALSKGFLPANLLAVERSSTVCQQLRSERVLTINSDVLNVLRSWPIHREVSVIFIDLCSGIEETTLASLQAALFMPPFYQSVIAFNVMRGRDARTTFMRDAMAMNFGMEKHRGILIKEYITSLMSYHIIKGLHPEQIVQGEADGEDRVGFNVSMKYISLLTNLMEPVFNEYRSSSGQMFDSIVFNNPFRIVHDYYELGIRKKVYCAEKDKGTSRKISAILAHRTRRLAI